MAGFHEQGFFLQEDVMLNVTKALFAGAIALSAAACAASTDSAQRYEYKRISQGPRPDQYVLVRAEQTEVDRPYALTGQTEKTRAQRPAVQPSHPKGTHDAY
jgi:hypothetical protein